MESCINWILNLCKPNATAGTKEVRYLPIPNATAGQGGWVYRNVSLYMSLRKLKRVQTQQKLK